MEELATNQYPPGQSPHRWRALFVLLASGFLTMLAVSILNVAVPSLVFALHISSTGVQWIMSGYALAGGLLLVPAGRLGDAYGRRRVFVIGIVLFILSSTIGGLAINSLMLIISRLFEGASSAIIMPQVVGLLQELFVGVERARAFAYFGTTIGVATAIGPTLGGIFLALLGANWGWRAAFFLNLPLCSLLIWLTYNLLPNDNATDGTKKLDLDPAGIVLLGLATLLVMLPFIHQQGQSNSFLAIPWHWLALGILVSIVFLYFENRQEKRKRDVIVPRTLLKDRSYMVGTLVLATYFAGFSSIFIVYTLYLQQGLGLLPWQAGVLQIPIAMGTALFSGFSPRLVNILGRWALVLSNSIVIFGLVLTSILVIVLKPIYLPYALAFSVFFIGMGSGLLVPAVQSLSLITVPVSTGGTAGGLSQTAQRVACAIGLAIVTLVFYLSLEHPDTNPGEGFIHLIYTRAFIKALLTIIAMQLLTLIITIIDAFTRPGKDILNLSS